MQIYLSVLTCLRVDEMSYFITLSLSLHLLKAPSMKLKRAAAKVDNTAMTAKVNMAVIYKENDF